MSAQSTFTVGPRVRFAREKLRMNQEELARLLGFSDRQTVSDIENSKRNVKADELLQLSDILDQDVEFFIDPLCVVGEAKYSWRASNDLSAEALDQFEATANGWLGLLRWLRQQDPIVEPSHALMGLRIGSKSSFEDAQMAGEQVAKVLELGDVPAEKLAECLETELDIPVLYVDVPAGTPTKSISGAACKIDRFGAILINRMESTYRRNFNLAHELFHALTWDAIPPDRRESNSPADRVKEKRTEQLANNFASALLMPSSSLNKLIDPEKDNDPQHLADVAEKLQVSTEALGWRLLLLKRINEQTRSQLAALRLVDNKEPPKEFSKTFVLMLHVALDKGRISARKAARVMSRSLFELTNLFKAYDMSAPFEL